VIVVITILLVIGIGESARVNNVIVAVKLAVILPFLIFAAPAFSQANWVIASNPEGHLIAGRGHRFGGP
jgi:APA family basic amino acid/polyamine antiporter